MEKFIKIKGIAAPLDILNIDTDMIIPKQFLKTIKRSGLGKNLFDEMRYTTNGEEIKSFVLNKDPWRNSKIIIAGDNFGCGSSREHAPWALEDYGFRTIIAPSFADIFFNNCFKNGMLPIVLDEATVEELFRDVAQNEGYTLTIDLEKQQIIRPNCEGIAFEVDAFRKHCLLNGLDDIGLTLQHADDIRAYEAARKQREPWVFG